jgi:RNA polymerase sigma-70 factor, ECF subfamily
MSNGSATRPWPTATAMEWRLTMVRSDQPLSGEPAESLDTLADPALVAQARDGVPGAFDVLVERHRRAIYQVCYRFVHQHEDASDLAQDVFVRAWRSLGSFKGDAAFSTWLYRIAVNLCLNRVSARKLPSEPLDDGDRFEDARVERPGTALLRGERAQVVRRAIQALPKKQRATVILRVFHQLSHQQIADVLGSSVGAVKANFFHALGNLRKILGQEP